MDGTEWVISERSAMLSRLYYGLTVPLLILTVATLALRFYLRIRPVYKLGLDDWCVLLGTVRCSVSFVFPWRESLVRPLSAWCRQTTLKTKN